MDASARARAVSITTAYKDLRGASTALLPQRVAIVGQGNTASSYDTTKAQYTRAFDVGSAYGFGSPVHLAARQFFPDNGDGIGTIPLTVYPLEDAGTGVASTGDITPSGTVTKAGAFRVVINNIESAEFTVAIGDAVADIIDKMVIAVAANVNLPMTGSDGTTQFDLTSKWKGTSANDLYVAVTGATDTGISFAITQPSGGLVNPDVDGALDQIGDIWETMVLNCMDIADTTTLDKFQTVGDARWGELVKKPLVVFSGNTNTTVSTATVVSDARTTDKINAQLVAPGSKDLPFIVAARQLSKILVVANNNPARDYGSQAATGLTPGTDAEQWSYADSDQAVKAGSSTIKVKDGVIYIGDVVTFYHPSGNPLPEYSYVVDIVKLQNIIYNLDLIFNTSEWDGCPLIPDTQTAPGNPSAKQPKIAKAAISTMLEGLANQAIISDLTFAKENIVAEINSTNPKRLDISLTVKLSGNTNIIPIDLYFGFYFGGV